MAKNICQKCGKEISTIYANKETKQWLCYDCDYAENCKGEVMA